MVFTSTTSTLYSFINVSSFLAAQWYPDVEDAAMYRAISIPFTQEKLATVLTLFTIKLYPGVIFSTVPATQFSADDIQLFHSWHNDTNGARAAAAEAVMRSGTSASGTLGRVRSL